jgi:hypothetical protein
VKPNRIHVVRRWRVDGYLLGWGVWREGGERATWVFETPKEALKRGTALAKKEKAELVVHAPDDDDLVVEVIDFSKKLEKKPKGKKKKARAKA